MKADDMLDAAITDGDVDGVRRALRGGASPDGKGAITPLHRATAKGETEIVRILLDAGANADVADDDGETPLQWARFGGYREIECLLAVRRTNDYGG